MARIAGIDLPKNKRVVVGLMSIYGIGRTSSEKILSEAGVDHNKKVSELTDDEEFWAGCKSCVNYEILMSKDRKNCMCTAMLYDPADHYEPEETIEEFKKHSKLYERFMRSKSSRLLKYLKGKQGGDKKKNFFSLLFNL